MGKYNQARNVPVEKLTLYERFIRKMITSFYIGKFKIHLDHQPTPVYRFGVTYYATYKQLEFNAGKWLINIWYHKDMI